jgi:bZIP transcription factor
MFKTKNHLSVSPYVMPQKPVPQRADTPNSIGSLTLGFFDSLNTFDFDFNPNPSSDQNGCPSPVTADVDHFPMSALTENSDESSRFVPVPYVPRYPISDALEAAIAEQAMKELINTAGNCANSIQYSAPPLFPTSQSINDEFNEAISQQTVNEFTNFNGIASPVLYSPSPLLKKLELSASNIFSQKKHSSRRRIHSESSIITRTSRLDQELPKSLKRPLHALSERDEYFDSEAAKRQTSLERNRIAALKCRLKKKECMENLEAEVARLQGENNRLVKELEMARQQNGCEV